jgi:1-acyl-sn-glycerol-3-phosphate acyltransferase
MKNVFLKVKYVYLILKTEENMYYFIVRFLRIVIGLFRLLKVEGKQHLPQDTKFVVTCTHRGWVDVIMLPVALYPTQIHFMAKKELFKTRIMDKFMNSVNAFPVNRENPGPSSLKTPLKLLKANKCVGIFPSGTRTSEDAPLKRGAVTISIKANAPLVPAAYTGPKNFKEILRGKKAKIIFGKAIEVDVEETNKTIVIDNVVKKLESEMKKLEKEGEKK